MVPFVPIVPNYIPCLTWTMVTFSSFPMAFPMAMVTFPSLTLRTPAPAAIRVVSVSELVLDRVAAAEGTLSMSELATVAAPAATPTEWRA